LAAENPREHLRLTLVGALVDEDAGGPLGLSRPQITLPSSDPEEAQFVQVDIAVMALPDVPKQDRLAKAVIRGLGERARARDGTAAIVKPVSGDVPVGSLCHRQPLADRADLYLRPQPAVVEAALPHLAGVVAG
jgi:hypothetical protein